MIAINSFLVAYVGIYLFSSIADVVIDLINEYHLKRFGGIIPEGFKGIVDEEKLKQMDEYTIDKSRFSIFRAIVGKCVFLVIILSGLLPWAAGILEGFNFIPAGLIFFAIPGLIGALADLPFGYYHIFRIEGQYGFNTISIRAWVCDLLKSLVIGVILGAILLSLLLLMVRFTGSMWWLWAWLIFIAFQLLITIVYPTLIAPVFNKFTPIQNDELAGKIRGLADREGLTVKGIFQMDAGRRSRHTNAYFSGLGRAKRIVLYDTLLESHEQDEIMAVLAHEIGHLRKGHIKKQLAIMGIATFILFFLASRMILWDAMYSGFGFTAAPAYVGLFLLAIIWEPVGFFLSPLAMALSRKFEREADRYAYRILKTATPFVAALRRMAADNLSNLRPHPMYVRFNYSHPPLLARIRELEEMK